MFFCRIFVALAIILAVCSPEDFEPTFSLCVSLRRLRSEKFEERYYIKGNLSEKS